MEEIQREPRAILVVKDRVFYSKGVTVKLLPGRPENEAQFKEPVWKYHTVWEFNEPDLYANYQTAWFNEIPGNLDSFYDPEYETYGLKVVFWDWTEKAKEEV